MNGQVKCPSEQLLTRAELELPGDEDTRQEGGSELLDGQYTVIRKESAQLSPGSKAVQALYKQPGRWRRLDDLRRESLPARRYTRGNILDSLIGD